MQHYLLRQETRNVDRSQTWMNWNVSLERSQCDKLNSHLLPYVNQFIHKRRFRSEVDDNKGKIKTNCMSCFLGLIWEKLHHLLENNLLFDGHVNWKVFLKDFWPFISQPLTLYCWALKRFSYYPLFTIMFQKGKKRSLHLMWFKMASFVFTKLCPLRQTVWILLQFLPVCF